MADDNTAELILTPDGIIKNIVFVEELVAAAPILKNWKVTALKPSLDIGQISIRMAGHEFHKDNLQFCFTNDPERPDNIGIIVVHEAYSEADRSGITNGCYIFLDNFLGELNFINMIDVLHVGGKEAVAAGMELVPIGKLKDYLLWREKEFVEKYEAVVRSDEQGDFAMLQATLPGGNPLIAMVNLSLLRWEGKVSHPWIAEVSISYDGSRNSGLPDKETLARLEALEDAISGQLKDVDGYLYIGRQTADHVREMYFACKEFRKPSKVLYGIRQQHAGELKIGFDIFKDKYWVCFDRFIQN